MKSPAPRLAVRPNSGAASSRGCLRAALPPYLFWLELASQLSITSGGAGAAYSCWQNRLLVQTLKTLPPCTVSTKPKPSAGSSRGGMHGHAVNTASASSQYRPSTRNGNLARSRLAAVCLHTRAFRLRTALPRGLRSRHCGSKHGGTGVVVPEPGTEPGPGPRPPPSPRKPVTGVVRVGPEALEHGNVLASPVDQHAGGKNQHND